MLGITLQGIPQNTFNIILYMVKPFLTLFVGIVLVCLLLSFTSYADFTLQMLVVELLVHFIGICIPSILRLFCIIAVIQYILLFTEWAFIFIIGVLCSAFSSSAPSRQDSDDGNKDD